MNHQAEARKRLQAIQAGWSNSSKSLELSSSIEAACTGSEPLSDSKPSARNFPVILLTLIHRSFIKSYRDVVAYGIRIAMYFGLAVMMGTV